VGCYLVRAPSVLSSCKASVLMQSSQLKGPESGSLPSLDSYTAYQASRSRRTSQQVREGLYVHRAWLVDSCSRSIGLLGDRMVSASGDTTLILWDLSEDGLASGGKGGSRRVRLLTSVKHGLTDFFYRSIRSKDMQRDWLVSNFMQVFTFFLVNTH
jgi:hypothetical protein